MINEVESNGARHGLGWGLICYLIIKKNYIVMTQDLTEKDYPEDIIWIPWFYISIKIFSVL